MDTSTRKAPPPSPFTCRSCGAAYAAAEARCRGCRSWDTIQRTDGLAPVIPITRRSKTRVESIPLTDIIEDEGAERFSTGTPAFDRVIGGGLLPGCTILISGEPGIGKSTLLLRLAADMTHSLESNEGKVVLYATAEQAEVEIMRLATRIDAMVENFHVIATTQFSDVEREVRKLRPDVLVVDSVSKMRASSDGEPGSTGEVKRMAKRVDELVLRSGGRLVVMNIAHVTKDNSIAGPMQMQHDFDATLFLESTGSMQTLRSLKSRLGPLAASLFEMTERGMEPVENPSERFLADRIPGLPGSVVGVLCDSERIAKTTLFEVQALASQPKPTGKRQVSATGVDDRRVSQILDVLERSMGEAFPSDALLAARDIRINVPGGLSSKEPSCDLAIALAVASSVLQLAVNPKLVAFGEIGLVGEIRHVPRAEPRIQEAFNMGFRKALAPRGTTAKVSGKFETLEVTTLAEALHLAFDRSPETKKSAPKTPAKKTPKPKSKRAKR